MKIIGHRGAAGLALENTLESIRSARKAGVDAVEIDVRLTRDKHLVLLHDVNTGRVSPSDLFINETRLEDLQNVTLHNGQRVPTLKEALRVAGDAPLVVEAKGGDWARPLAEFLSKNESKDARVIAFNHDELSKFSSLSPEVPVYALERWSPIDVIQTARQKKFTGIDLNFWILNPLTYWLARRAGLDIIVFTVNRAWIARFLKLLYPHISITTNYPDKLQSIRNRS